MSNSTNQFVRASTLADVRSAGCLTVQLEGHTVALFAHDGAIYAVDNRCPHMGFPLDQGSVQDGILTCHWHHARFDLESGGTFDPWADDVRQFPVDIRDSYVWVDITPEEDPCLHQCGRLLVGLERDIPLVIGKAVLQLAAGDREMAELDARYPGYGLAKHKGYPTRQHLEALQLLGASEIHRRSFGPVKRLLEQG